MSSDDGRKEDTSVSGPGRIPSDIPFFLGIGGLALCYTCLITALVLANMTAIEWQDLLGMWYNPDIHASIRLTFLTCSVSAILSILCAVPIGYLLSRFRFPGRAVIDAVLDIPIVLPPLVVGLSLLILFNKVPFAGGSLEKWLNDHGMMVTFAIPAIILAQFTVATAFAIRVVKNTFDQIDHRSEQVAMTLGCNRSGAFWNVALPQAGQGLVAAGVLAWARALGEFGPILVFAGATRGRTEVLATSVFLEINIGNLGGAAAVSLLMIILALGLISLIRFITRSKTPFL
ncbi:MAG: ABC transporter permease [Akkermansiaceae bacterium]|nr:ABC transporter permease [Akkermansiaceae bacterium]